MKYLLTRVPNNTIMVVIGGIWGATVVFKEVDMMIIVSAGNSALADSSLPFSVPSLFGVLMLI